MPTLPRNQFHAAWLLLLLPPLIGLLIPDEAGGLAQRLGQGLRLLMAGAFVGALLWLRSQRVSSPVLRLLKEVRQQLPGALIAFLGPGLVGWHPSPASTAIGVGCLMIGFLLMGASTFGAEFENRTIGSLLVQPVPRAELFAEKMGVALALGVIAYLNFGVMALSNPAFHITPGETLVIAVYAAVPLCSGAWFSLISRSTLAGAVFSVAVPGVMTLLLSTGLSLLERWTSLGVGGNPWFERCWLVAIALYIGGTPLLGWWTFSRLELRDGGAGGRSATSLHPLSRPLDWILSTLLPARSATALLIRKELRLHVLPWLMALVTIGLWLVWMAACALASAENREQLRDVSTVCVLAGILGTIGLIGAGAACVAEERELGTLDWQLTQPVPLGRQWWIKVGIACLLASLLSVALPAVLVLASFDTAALRKAFEDTDRLQIVSYAAAFSLMLVSSIHASSLTRSTMKATAATVGISGLLAGSIAIGVAWTSIALEMRAAYTPPAWLGLGDDRLSSETAVQFSLTLLGIAASGIWMAMLILAGRNFRSGIPSSRTLVRQLGLISIGSCLLVRLVGEGFIIVVHLATRGG